METSKPVNIAQIGVGYWGPNLLRNLIANRRCNTVMVSDLSPERREFARKLHSSVGLTADPAEVFGDSRVEAVVIATPVATHFALTKQALQADKHVLVEKPMACTVDEIDEIAAIAAAAKKVAMVGHTFLYNPAVRYLKKLIDAGTIGDVRYIYSQRLNLGRIRSDVDALWNLAPHDVSIIQYLLGNPKPVSVVRKGMDYIQKGVDDVVFMNIEYPHKVLAQIHVSWLDPQKIRKMTVVGTKKMVVYDDVADDKIAIYDKGIEPKAVLGEKMDYDRSAPVKFDHRSGDILLPKISSAEPLAVEIDHFIDCIQTGAACLTGTAHAREVVGILSCAG